MRGRASRFVVGHGPVRRTVSDCSAVDGCQFRAHSFFFSSRRRHTRFDCDWSSDVCSSDLARRAGGARTGLLDQRAAGAAAAGREAMKLLIATRNDGKVREIRDIFVALPFQLVFPADQFLERLPEEQDLERGSSFSENAVAKARYFADRKSTRLNSSHSQISYAVFCL